MMAAMNGAEPLGDGVFEGATRRLLDLHGRRLLDLAAASIRNGLDGGRPLRPAEDDFPAALWRPGASFVTLKKNTRLRGCIGSLVAQRPLAVDVAENAFACAFRDPRFAPLESSEWDEVSLSVTILSPSQPMAFDSEADLLGQLRPATDGLIIEDGSHRALFLPAVWESLPEKKDFLAHLKAKAGLAADHWSDTFTARRFVALDVSDSDKDTP
jgi:AmmeMemoRadiSam system protein A